MSWARAHAHWRDAWAECPRGDWLLGVAVRAGVESQLIARAACACAREALIHAGVHAPEARAAIEAAEEWAAGPEGSDPGSCATAALRAEACAEQTTDPVIAAALGSASMAARSAIEPSRAPNAAVLALEAEVHAVGDCAMMEAMRFSQRRSAEHVREHVPFDTLRDRVV